MQGLYSSDFERDSCGGDTAPCFIDEVADEQIDQAAARFVTQYGSGGLRITCLHLGENVAVQGLGAQIFQIQQAGAQAVVDIMVIVGDLVGEIDDLGFQAGLGAAQKALPHIPQVSRFIFGAVFEDALARLKTQVEAREVAKRRRPNVSCVRFSTPCAKTHACFP